MKAIVITFIGLITLFACSEDCEVIDNSICNEVPEVPPTDELCDAYFNRWFYISQSNKCELIGYSGCSQRGFATKEECEHCN